jgi:carboxyl-terminal processing protease
MKTRMIMALGLVAFTLSIPAAEFGGIGLVIVDRRNANEPLRTGSGYTGSPAERAGITTNGFLISVDGTNIVSMSLTQATSMVRGPVGQSVTIEVADAKMSATNKVTITRRRIMLSANGIEFSDR